MRKLAALVACLAAGLRSGQVYRRGLDRGQARPCRARFRRSHPPRRAAPAHPRNGRMGALQARPGHRPYPRRRGAGHQRGAVEHRPRPDPRIFRRGGGRRGATAPCSRSATTSRRSSASRAPIRQSFEYARAWFARAGRGGGPRLPRPVDGPELPLLAADPRRGRPADRAISATKRSACRAPPNPHGSHHSKRPGLGHPVASAQRGQ